MHHAHALSIGTRIAALRRTARRSSALKAMTMTMTAAIALLLSGCAGPAATDDTQTDKQTQKTKRESKSAEAGKAEGKAEDKAEGKDAAGPTAEDAQLVERARAAAEAAQGTPGQEHANRLNTRRGKEQVKRLTGEAPASAGQLKRARRAMRSIAEKAGQGPDWPEPPVIRAPRFPRAPKIDGKLDESAWKNAAIFEQTFAFNDTEPVQDFATRWQVGWDSEHLYVAYECTDRDLIAPEIERDGPLYKHDCVEIFILPRFATGSYWEVIVSPSGSVLDALHAKKFDSWGAVSQFERDMDDMRVGVTVRGTLNDSSDTDSGYTVELAIPFDALPEYSRAEPAVGHTLHAMLCRLNKTGDKMTPYAFTPLLAWGHNIWNHARLELVEAKETR